MPFQIATPAQIHIASEASRYASTVIVHPLALLSLCWIQTVCEFVATELTVGCCVNGRHCWMELPIEPHSKEV